MPVTTVASGLTFTIPTVNVDGSYPLLFSQLFIWVIIELTCPWSCFSTAVAPCAWPFATDFAFEAAAACCADRFAK